MYMIRLLNINTKMAATIFGTRNIVQHNKWGIHRKKQSKIHRVPQIIELEIPNLQLSPKLENYRANYRAGIFLFQHILSTHSPRLRHGSSNK